MPNIGLADVSNATLVLAIVLYAIAMLAYACDFAFGKRQPAEVAAAGQSARVESVALVGAARGVEFAGHAFPADPGDPSELADLSADNGHRAGTGTGAAAGGPSAGAAAGGAAGEQRDKAGFSSLPEPAAAVRQSPWPRSTWVRSAFLLTCAGLVVHIASVATRGLSEHRVPWGNMYEFIAAITCAAVLVLVLGAVRLPRVLPRPVRAGASGARRSPWT